MTSKSAGTLISLRAIKRVIGLLVLAGGRRRRFLPPPGTIPADDWRGGKRGHAEGRFCCLSAAVVPSRRRSRHRRRSPGGRGLPGNRGRCPDDLVQLGARASRWRVPVVIALVVICLTGTFVADAPRWRLFSS